MQRNQELFQIFIETFYFDFIDFFLWLFSNILKIPFSGKTSWLKDVFVVSLFDGAFIVNKNRKIDVGIKKSRKILF